MKKMRFFASMMLLACIAIFATSCAEEGSPADSIKGTYNGTYTVYTVVNGTQTSLCDPVSSATLRIIPVTDNGATVTTQALSFKYKETGDGADQTIDFPAAIIPVTVEEATSGYTINGTFTVPTLNVSLSATGSVVAGIINAQFNLKLGVTDVTIAFSNVETPEPEAR